jgi:hypothetical protein
VNQVDIPEEIIERALKMSERMRNYFGLAGIKLFESAG